MTSRKKIWADLQEDPTVSVLVIGGGINGISTFRDLALQGVDVLLVERDDYCSGASAASSHMVHGGIRYLENGEFRLVREAVHERNLLLENAPHLVRPLGTNIPIFTTFSGLLNAPLKFLGVLNKPSERGRIVIKLGLMMYDAYTREQGRGSVPGHQFVGREAALKQYPAINPEIVALATYYDAAMPMPERIALELLLDGEETSPKARALNYVAAAGSEGDQVILNDQISGETVAVKPKLVINAAGPWIDFANDAIGEETHFIGGTKGSHIVVDHPELYKTCDGHEFFFENNDGRIVLIYPVNDRVIIGTSDIPIDNPDNARCTEEEIDYFLRLVKKMFPHIDVDRSHIVFKFSGVRPLPASDANTTGQISRDHQNRILEPDDDRPFPVFNLIGGKWTTFRAFGEQVTDAALERLGLERRVSTEAKAIGGGKNYPKSDAAREQWITDQVEKTGLSRDRMRKLFDRYGTRAAPMGEYIAAGKDQPLEEFPSFSQREIRFLVDREKVVRLEDLLLRRTPLGLYGYLTLPLIQELGNLAAETLGWSPAEKERQIADSLSVLAEKHDLDLS